MTTALAFVVVLFGVIGGSSYLVKALHGFNLFVLVLTMLLTYIYERRFSKKDLLRTD